MKNKSSSSRSLLLVFIGVIIAFFFVVRWFSTLGEKPKTLEGTSITPNPVKPTCVVTVLKQDANSYHILVKLPTTDTSTVFKAANDCKAYYCPDGHCNMAFYDNKQAYILQQEVLKIDPQNINAWDRKHRNFIADHTLAYIFPNEDFVGYYPLVDLTYKEMGGKNLRGKDL